MQTRLNGKFYTHDKAESGGGMSYGIRIKADEVFDPRLGNDMIFASFGSAEDRDKYFAEWTDEELSQVHEMIVAMWKLPRSMVREKPSLAIERLKDKVQKRAGIVNT